MPDYYLASEELDELPDDSLWRDTEGGRQLLAAGQEQLGVERLQHWQGLGQEGLVDWPE